MGLDKAGTFGSVPFELVLGAFSSVAIEVIGDGRLCVCVCLGVCFCASRQTSGHLWWYSVFPRALKHARLLLERLKTNKFT